MCLAENNTSHSKYSSLAPISTVTQLITERDVLANNVAVKQQETDVEKSQQTTLIRPTRLRHLMYVTDLRRYNIN